MARFIRLSLAVLAILRVASTASLVAQAAEATNSPTSLAGEWRFALDRADTGVKEHWFSHDLSDRITLPGILQAQGYGDDISVDTPWVAALPRDMRWYLLPQYQAYTKPGNVKMPYLSQPPKHYLGVAWYQRDIEISDGWKEKRAVLTLERARWETTVYVDEKKVGSCHSLVAPHEFDLGTLSAGKHRLSVRMDNRMILPYRPDGHGVSDGEGSTWNGIVGRIELTVTSPVWIEDAQVFPNVARKSALIKVQFGNSTGRAGNGTIAVREVSVPASWEIGGGKAEIEVPLGSSAAAWSEFSPVLQHLTVKLSGTAADDSRDLTFGLREIRREGKHMVLNGTTINLRATHDGGGFPLTGYPPTDVDSWKRIISICKAWGLNGMRFHSWCPPKAAFTAADELGFYLQSECGMWNSFDAAGKMLEILNDETTRMVKAYGNHPSFILLAATNEPAGHYQEQLPVWDKKWREADPRRLYADGTGRPSVPASGQHWESDFVTTGGFARVGRARGPGGWFGADYEPALHELEIPALGHEVGQWCAYPDFSVIQKFTGYLRPGNYEIVRDSASAHGLLENNKELAYASGRFQLACYKEEIEASLRTASFSGIELLDLHDYLGQGGAFIGLLDAFWESKGYASPQEFSRFCNTTVPLARLHNRVFTTSDTLTADVELAHFGPAPLANIVPEWRIEDSAGATVVKGQWPARDVLIGKNIPLGKVAVNLSKFLAPSQYKLTVGLRTTHFQNSWNFWLYPATVEELARHDVLVTSAWPEAEARLSAGGKVLFQPKPNDLDSSDPKLSTVPIFWNRLMNPSGAWMLGLWCNVKHAALAGFPTEAGCDWQWVDLIRDTRALNLDTLPRQLRPIVQPIDDWNRNYKLALIYDCKVGPGRLLVCSIDLQTARPGTATLRKSLLDYMNSDQFQPAEVVSAVELRKQWISMRGSKYIDTGATQPVQPTAPEVDAPPGISAPTPRR